MDEREEIPCRTETSVLFGQKQSGHGSIRFGDNPELLGLSDLVAAHQAESVLKTQFVFSLVFLAEIAPLCGIHVVSLDSCIV